MLDINGITAVIILFLPVVIDVLKRLIPNMSDSVLKILIGIVSIVVALVVELATKPAVDINDLILRVGVIFTAAQVVYDKIYAGTGLSKVLTGEK